MRVRLMTPVAALLLAAAGCGDGTGPDTRSYAIAVVGGDGQFGGAGQELPDPLEVRVTDGGEPVEGISVRWTVVAGVGAALTPTSSTTDSDGVARTVLRLGSQTGIYEVEAGFSGLEGEPARFRATAIDPPVVASVSPTQAAAGDTVMITGENFSPNAADNVVLFDGMRGTTIEATATRILATVPRCVPTRTTSLTVRVGAVESAPARLDVTGDGGAPVDLAVGDVLMLSDPAEMACLRLPGGQSGIAYLAVQQNAHRSAGEVLPFQLVGLTGQAPPLVSLAERRATALPAGEDAFPAAWEARLRLRERTLPLDDAAVPSAPRIRTLAELPAVGSRTEFNVFNKDDAFTRVTAEVKYVSDEAVIYQDVNAPSGGFTDGDFESFAALFDDPIFATDSTAFGAPSDIDENGRIIILFTPVVNELTPADSPPGSGFVAGFFYGLDLTEQANSNRAEIFYSLVPDPEGVHGNVRTLDDIRRAVPPVLAHELQHMIHFNQRILVKRAARQDSLWLSEGLAHMAEDLVADALYARGDVENGANFRGSNYTRAARYLDYPAAVSLVDVEAPGSLEERGAQWLFIKYLAGHYGGTQVLRKLTQTVLGGVSNVEAATGEAWETLFGRWAVALWADDAPELAASPPDPAYTYPNIDLRAALGSRGYPLQPAAFDFTDVLVADELPVSSPLHLIFEARQFDPDPFHLSFTRARGDDFRTGDRPRWAILRIR